MYVCCPLRCPQIAASLKAEKLILMTDVPGVMRDKDDVSTKFASLSIRNCKELVDEGVIAGGMIPKVGHWVGRCCWVDRWLGLWVRLGGCVGVGTKGILLGRPPAACP